MLFALSVLALIGAFCTNYIDNRDHGGHLNQYDIDKIVEYLTIMDEYHPEYESFDSVDQEEYQLFDESMYLIPENYEIVRHNNDENLNATTFQLTHHLH